MNSSVSMVLRPHNKVIFRQKTADFRGDPASLWHRKTYACRLICCGSVTCRKKCNNPQLAVEATQRNPTGVIRVQSFRISSRFALRG
jgi:hypothetical protein